MTFRSGATPICVNKAKVVFTGYGPAYREAGLELFGPLAQPQYTTNAPGGKVLGAKCFKGRGINFSLVHDSPAVFMAAAVVSPGGLASVSYTGASPYPDEDGQPPVRPRLGYFRGG